MPLETIRYETTLAGEPVVLEVRQLPAVQALRLLNRMGGVLANALASLQRGAFAGLPDADFEHLQRTLLASVVVRGQTLDFDGFMELIGPDAELVLGLLWAVAQATYPRSFSAARRALADPASLTGLLASLRPSGARAAPAPSASATNGGPPPSRPSAY